ncbi:pirin family protein [Prolixibacteraceae bacterium JC049]|nr:pirin family protein [Prolixibacteraceae bacterium JC049]
MPKSVFHSADSRGYADHDWLQSYHTFSFASYYDKDRMHFGVLRVLNDDTVQGGKGFGTHPHDNMEIVSIPLEGDLEHKDSMGNVSIIKHGDIQVMSAGTGIYHSEFNKNSDKSVKFLQIWIYPNKRDVKPRYDQITMIADYQHNQLQQVLSPEPDDEGVWIHQNAWFYMGKFQKGKEIDYQLKKRNNGIYLFVLEGSFSCEDHTLNQRDGLGIWETNQLAMQALSDDARILIMEVPMER